MPMRLLALSSLILGAVSCTGLSTLAYDLDFSAVKTCFGVASGIKSRGDCANNFAARVLPGPCDVKTWR